MGKYAVLLHADTDRVGRAATGLAYALDLDAAGHEVAVFFDGAATQWPGRLSKTPDHPVTEDFAEARDRGLVAGACEFCATAFDCVEECRDAGVELLGDETEHAPDLGALATDGYEFVTV